MTDKCFNCDNKGTEFYDEIICNTCKSKLKLFKEETVKKYSTKFTKPVYKKEIKDKLLLLEKDFIKKKIKLLDILSKIK